MARKFKAEIDFRRLRNYFADNRTVVDARYYTLCRPDGYTPIRPLLDWLSYNGFTVVVKRHRSTESDRNSLRSGVAVDLACDALSIARQVDRIVLCSGDGRYQALAESVQARGVQFLALSTRRSNPPMIADELRRQIDDFIELEDILPSVSLIRD
jgi:uncharacterized LabA/DUF88 family protein